MDFRSVTSVARKRTAKSDEAERLVSYNTAVCRETKIISAAVAAETFALFRVRDKNRRYLIDGGV